MYSDYHSPIFQIPTYRKVVKNVLAQVKEIKKVHKIVAVAFRGVSGASMGFHIVYKHKLSPIIVRKTTQYKYTHANYLIESIDWKYENLEHETLSYIIVDDFICSGNTINTIYKRVQQIDKRFDCVGIILYAREGSGKRSMYEIEKGEEMIPTPLYSVGDRVITKIK